MTPKIYFKKYSQGNYFDGLDFIDSLEVLSIPADGFPVFDINTEQVGGVLQYTAGEFDIQLLIDQSETSANSDSIYDFFMGGSRNYKFLAIVWFGTYSPVNNNWKYFAGTFTNEEITFYYTSRRLSFRVKPMQNEVQAAMVNHMIGTMGSDRTLNQFLQILLPTEISDYLSVVTSFFDYGTLIGDTTVKFRALIWDTASWVGVVDIWEQFIQIMRGTGLSFRIRMYPENSVLTNFPEFIIYVFPLSSVPAGAALQITGDPEDTTIFKKKKFVALITRRYALNSAVDGCYGVITDGAQFWNYDKFHQSYAAEPFGQWAARGFLQDKRQGDANGQIKYIDHYPIDPEDIVKFNADETAIIDLTLFRYSFAFQGSIPFIPTMADLGETISISRALCTPSPGYSSLAVQLYTINQNMRYILGLKRIKKVDVVWDSSHMYDVYEQHDLVDEARSRSYYTSRVQNIKQLGMSSTPPQAQLTLIEI